MFQLAHKTEHKPNEFSSEFWCFQIKYDGSRYLLIKNNSDVQFIIRNSETNKVAWYPELHRDFTKMPNGIFDGELIFRTENRPYGDFYKLLKRENKNPNNIMEKSDRFKFVVFDVLIFEGKDLRNRPYAERLKYLDVIKKMDLFHIEVAKTFLNGKEAVKEALENNAEGIMIKKQMATHTTGRTYNMLKYKFQNKERFDVVGFTSKSRAISSLILEDKGKYVGKVDLTKAKYMDFLLNNVVGQDENGNYILRKGITAIVRYMPVDKGQKLRQPILEKIEGVNGQVRC